MWPWLPERVVVVHIPCVLERTYLLQSVLQQALGQNLLPTGAHSRRCTGSKRVSAPGASFRTHAGDE